MKFIAFDLETTGIFTAVDSIIEIGAIRFEDGEPTEMFSTLVDPQRSIPPDASRVNGITDDMVQGKPTIEQILDPFAEFCAEDLLVAHNAPFDAQFLTAAIKRAESKSPRGLVLDTLPIARKVFPGLMNYRLGTLVQHIKIPATGFHRAEADASYCGQLFWKMLKKISPQSGEVPIKNLVNYTGKPEFRFPIVEKKHKQLSLLDL